METKDRTVQFPEYRRKVGLGIWARNSHYAQHMLREWTSFFVAVFALIYIYELYLYARNPGAYQSLIGNPGIIFFNVIALIFVLYHATTWFYLTGMVQPIKIGKTITKPWQTVVVNLIFLVVIFYIVILLFGLK